MGISLSEFNRAGIVLKDGKELVKASTQTKKSGVKKIVPYVNSFGKINSYNLILDVREDTPVTGNKKVKNATKSVNAEGIKFDSLLEKYMYDLLRGARIEFEFQKAYTLQEKFRYGDEAVRAITLTVDFYLRDRDMIIDTKGWANDVAPVKYKMLKKYLMEEHAGIPDYEKAELPQIEMPKNKQECDLLLNRLLFDAKISKN